MAFSSAKKDMIPGPSGEFDIDVFRFSKSAIDELREKECSSDRNEFVSDQDIAMAYIWKKISSVVDIHDEDMFPLIMVYGTRDRLGLEKKYIGNSIYLESFENRKGEIRRIGLGCAARLMRKISDGITEKVLREDLAFWTSRVKERSVKNYFRRAYCLYSRGGLMINNWSKNSLYMMSNLVVENVYGLMSQGIRMIVYR